MVAGGSRARGERLRHASRRWRRRPATWCSALLISAAVTSVGCLPVGSTLAIFTKQTTVTANTVSAAANFPMCYRDAVLADNPASYWRLDETSGTTAADDKGAAAGTYRNGVTLGQTGALPDTINNKAAGFDAVDDDVQVGDVYDYAGTASFSWAPGK